MLAADTDFDLWICLSRTDRRPPHQLADSGAIEHCERVLLQDSLLHIRWQKLIDVVARKSKSRLGEIVCSKTEELGLAGNVFRDDRRARQLDHGPDQIIDSHLFFRKNFLRDPLDDR